MKVSLKSLPNIDDLSLEEQVAQMVVVRASGYLFDHQIQYLTWEPVLPHTPPRLATVELPPFKAAIATGVDAVMSAHLLIPAWDSQRPATLSQPILTDLLRGCLRFEGLIVTDDLVMGAIANRYGTTVAPVMAVEAGADILLMPVNPEQTIQTVCDAVAAGRISREQIRGSVERIWKAKAKVRPNSQGGSQGEGLGVLAQRHEVQACGLICSR